MYGILPDDDDPADEAWLLANGFYYHDHLAAYVLRDRRMSLCFRPDSAQLWLDFDATYSGQFGTYKKFHTRGEIRMVCRAVGFQTLGQTSTKRTFTRTQKQKMRELFCEPVE